MRHTYTRAEAMQAKRESDLYMQLRDGYYLLYSDLTFGSDIEEELWCALGDDEPAAVEAAIMAMIDKSYFPYDFLNDKKIEKRFEYGTPMRKALCRALLLKSGEPGCNLLYGYAAGLRTRDTLYATGQTSVSFESFNSMLLDLNIEGEDSETTATVHDTFKYVSQRDVE